MEKLIYFAPLEGITGREFRLAFSRYFKGVSEFYAPFISPKEKRGLDKKDRKELLPERNEGIRLIPQILTAEGSAFNHTLEKLMELGYEEVNLNLGCPSGTVVNKGRGAGALKKLENLDKLLDEIFSFSAQKGCKISIKTRIGFEKSSEFGGILEVYRKYPFEKLIIHPRTRAEFYKGKVHKESFLEALSLFSKKKERLCFNGDIFTGKAYKEIVEEFPEITSVMVGRGFLRNPFLIEEILGKRTDASEKKKMLKEFLETIFIEYVNDIGDERVATLKLKEIWSYVKELFQAEEGFEKEIRKAKNASEYKAAMNVIFSNFDLKEV